MDQRLEQAQKSRERLIASAARLLAERGWARSGSSDIGEGAGMSRGAAHAHFGSKDALLAAVWDDTVARFDHEWGRLRWPTESVEQLLDAYWRLIAHNDGLRRVAVALWIEARDQRSPVAEQAAQAHRDVLRLVERDVERLCGESSLDCRAYASLIVAALGGSVLELGSSESTPTHGRLADVRDMLLRCADAQISSG